MSDSRRNDRHQLAAFIAEEENAKEAIHQLVEALAAGSDAHPTLLRHAMRVIDETIDGVTEAHRRELQHRTGLTSRS